MEEMEDDELERIKNNPEFYEDTIEYQEEMERMGKGAQIGGMDMFQPPNESDEDKSTNS